MTQLDPMQAILPVRKQELVAFLYDMFDGKPGKPLKLSRSEYVGRFITSLRTYSDFPVKQRIPKDWIPVVVELPDSPYCTADRHFIFFNMEDVEKANDFIQGAFDYFFYVYFFDHTGLINLAEEIIPDKELTKLHLVDSFVAGLNLVDVGSSSDMIKKREYRKSIEILYRKRARFLKKGYRFRAKIYKKRVEFLKSVISQ